MRGATLGVQRAEAHDVLETIGVEDAIVRQNVSADWVELRASEARIQDAADAALAAQNIEARDGAAQARREAERHLVGLLWPHSDLHAVLQVVVW